MFLRKDTIKVPSGIKYLVPFCRECHSQDIEVIRTCKQCGSHNIKHGYSILDNEDNTYGEKQDYMEKTAYMYQCDICGDEFDGTHSDRYISYTDGEFNVRRYEYFSDYDSCDEGINYNLDKDVCDACKSKLQNILSAKLLDFTRPENIKELIDTYIENKGDNK